MSSPLIVSGKTVHQLRRGGVSLRDIAEETSLSPRTVRTIIDRRNGTDRTDQASAADRPGSRRRTDLAGQRRMRQALPRNIAAVGKANDKLRKKAKGLK